ncbi:MAG: plastocyanin/azurin family copper-binding protein [Longimicrobiales bacterium]|nr:plastocyanin/azurin family copper-binding protein [Longimicrobiales bacterium]
MDSRGFIRRGIAGVAGLIAVVALLACGSDSPTGNGNGGGGDPPTLSSISPNSGQQGSTVGVTLTGTNFDEGNASVSVSGSGVSVQNVSVSGATSITADFVIGDQATADARDVTVSTAAGTSGSVTFTVESSGGGGSNTVEADDNFFSPTTLEVNVGETVTWDNVGANDHTVTPDGHMEWTGTTLSPGETFQHTFNTAGTYDYVCTIHAGMDGTITVVQP